MKSKIRLILGWGILLTFFDQLTKFLVVAKMPQGSRFELVPHFVDIVHYRNPGAAFGLFAQWSSPLRDIFFFGVSLIALGLLIYYLWHTPFKEKRLLLMLTFILSGAINNLIDRIFRGDVVDFILLHWYNKVVSFQWWGRSIQIELVWPAFNVADSAITIGVIGLIIHTLFGAHPTQEKNK